jgi:hypothetical protein
MWDDHENKGQFGVLIQRLSVHYPLGVFHSFTDRWEEAMAPHKKTPMTAFRVNAALAGLLACFPVSAQQCEDLIKMDGLFTKARSACPFSYYAWRFQQDSQVCMEKVGKSASKDLFIKGQQTFDSKSKDMGKDALCQKLLRDFPMTVKR